MKKLLALLMAMAMVLALGVAAIADLPEDAEPLEREPVNYLAVYNDGKAEKDTVVTWKIDAEVFTNEINAEWASSADIKFEGIEGDDASITLAFWDSEDSLIDSYVLAKSGEAATEDWYRYSVDGIFVNLEGWENFAYATFSVGFSDTTGAIYLGPVVINANKEMRWTRGWSSEFDLEDEELDYANCANVSEDDLGIYVETVFQSIASVGTNLAAQEGASVKVQSGDELFDTNDKTVVTATYNGILNDGIIGADDLVPDWYGGHKGTGTIVDGQIGTQSGNLTTFIIDLGAEAEFNRIRLYYWARQEYGVAKPAAVTSYYSNDGENWTAYNDLLFELSFTQEDWDNKDLDKTHEVNWADTGIKEAATARYIKVEYLTVDGSWNMVSEIEVISTQAPDTSSEAPVESSEDEQSKTETSKPAVTSKDDDTSKSPVTGDNGFVALAVIASIAVAGAFIVKKSR